MKTRWQFGQSHPRCPTTTAGKRKIKWMLQGDACRKRVLAVRGRHPVLVSHKGWVQGVVTYDATKVLSTRLMANEHDFESCDKRRPSQLTVD